MKLNLYKTKLLITLFLTIFSNNFIQSSDDTGVQSEVDSQDSDIGAGMGHTSTPTISDTPTTPIEIQLEQIHQMMQAIQEEVNAEKFSTKELKQQLLTSSATIEQLKKQINAASFRQACIKKLTDIRDGYLHYLNAQDKTGFARYAQQATVVILSATAITILYKAFSKANKIRKIRAAKRAKVNKIINKLIINEERLSKLITQE